MSVDEVLKACGITRTTLYRWNDEKRLVPLPKRFPAKRNERRVYDKADVDRLIEEGRADVEALRRGDRADAGG